MLYEYIAFIKANLLNWTTQRIELYTCIGLNPQIEGYLGTVAFSLWLETKTTFQYEHMTTIHGEIIINRNHTRFTTAHTHTQSHSCTQHMQKESNCFSGWIKKRVATQFNYTRMADAVAAVAVGWGEGNPHLEPCLCISPIFIRFNLVFGTVACFVSNAFKFLLLKFMSTKVIFLIVFPGSSLWVFFLFSVFMLA